MTGAIDQMGHLQPIGAATEKVEGFFAICQARGFTGTQGCVIPSANAGELMLNPEVVAACADGKFSVYAVDSIERALELFTGMPAGSADAEGNYPPDTLLSLAQRRAREYWQMATDTKSDTASDT